MNYSEKWGKDVDEAVRLALADLELTEDEVVVTVLEEPTKGFFGLGANLAKVRVEQATDKNVAETKDDEKKPDKKDNNLGKVRDYRKKNKKSADSKPKESKDSKASRDSKDAKNHATTKDHTAEKDHAASRDYTAAKDSDNRKLKDVQISKKPDDLVEDKDGIAGNFLKQIVNDMSLDVEIESFKNDECFYIEVKGKDSRTVIGKRGQTLDALQYLTNLVVNKGLDEYIRVIIDVEGYRSRREKTLESLADKLARKAQKTGNSVRLEPMNPYERKVIHATLQGYDGITTRSEGEEPYRRVIIEKK